MRDAGATRMVTPVLVLLSLPAAVSGVYSTGFEPTHFGVGERWCSFAKEG